MDWEKIDKEMAQTILRQGEIYLQSTVQIALSSDQRSATLAAVFSAASVALLGALSQIDVETATLISGLALAALWFASAVLCIIGLWPTKYHTPGNYPSFWLTEEVAYGSLVEAIIGECENYDVRIRFNVKRLTRAATLFKCAIASGVAAPIFAVLVWGVLKIYVAV